jgi:hypothetical protein
MPQFRAREEPALPLGRSLEGGDEFLNRDRTATLSLGLLERAGLDQTTEPRQPAQINVRRAAFLPWMNPGVPGGMPLWMEVTAIGTAVRWVGSGPNMPPTGQGRVVIPVGQ